MYKIKKEHPFLQNKNFEILSSGFRNNTKKRKLLEALWINTLTPFLNIGWHFNIEAIRLCFLKHWLAF